MDVCVHQSFIPETSGNQFYNSVKKLDSQYRLDDLGMTPSWMKVCRGHMDVKERPPHG